MEALRGPHEPGQDANWSVDEDDAGSTTHAPPSLSMQGRPRLGALLISEGLITEGQLQEALAQKEQTGERLGEIIVSKEWVDDDSLARALAKQHGLEYIDLALQQPNPTAANLLPERYANQYRAVPLRFLTGGSVLVAVADPTDVVASRRSQAGYRCARRVRRGHATSDRVRHRPDAWLR